MTMMNKTSKPVPVAVAPPIPVTKKEYSTLVMMDPITNAAVLSGGKDVETVRILVSYSYLGLTQQA